MKRTLFGLGLVGFAVLAGAGTFGLLSPHGAKRESHGSARGFCSSCGKRVWSENAPCPNCGARADGIKSVSTEKGTVEAPATMPVKPATKLTIVLSMVVVLLLALNLQQLRRLLRRRIASNGFLVLRCDRCRCKLRYLAENAGGAGLCPRCGNRVAYPESSAARTLVPVQKTDA